MSLRGGKEHGCPPARPANATLHAVATEPSLCSTPFVSAPEKRSPGGLGSTGMRAVADSLDELVRAHSPYIAGLAYRLLGRDAEVDDVVQDVFVALLRFHGSVREPNALRAWLATTTVRLSLRRLRARQLRFRSLLGLDEPEPASVPAPGANSEEHAALARVHAALTGISASARVAWLLRYVEQERMEDIARYLGCSLTTAKRRV